MNFHDRMLPTSREYAFCEEGYFVWGAAMFKHKDNYYMVYSRWQQEKGFEAWVTDSELCLAKSDSPLGKFSHVKVLFGNNEKGGIKKVYHNPTIIEYNGRIYLYFMMNEGAGDWWEHRNNQRIGVAYTDNPEGEWIKADRPVIDVSEEGIDSLMTSNPTACVTDDGKILMVYKAVSKYGELPKGGKVLCGVAKADSPLGPFIKDGKPVMENPENPWSVEDPYIWKENGSFYALVKDFHGYFAKTNGRAVVLFTSKDGHKWECNSEYPLAFVPQLNLGDHTEKVHFLERPQLFFEDGKCKVLLLACMEKENDHRTYNIRIPIG